MEIPDVIKFVMDAGGPTVIAALALVIMYKFVMKLVPDMMAQWKDATDTMMASQDASTEALTRLTTTMEQVNDIMGETNKFLIKLNGKE